MFTMMLLHMYQIFSFLRGHLHFSVHFFLRSIVNLFLTHPISTMEKEHLAFTFPNLRMFTL